MDLFDMKPLRKGTMLEVLGIELLEADPDHVRMSMPVGPRVYQPAGILHGGASVALAESAASIAATLNIDRERQFAVGLEINANHIRTKRDGTLYADATPLHRGRTTSVWDVRITDEQGKLVCVSRCTVAIRDKALGV